MGKRYVLITSTEDFTVGKAEEYHVNRFEEYVSKRIEETGDDVIQITQSESVNGRRVLTVTALMEKRKMNGKD